MVKAADIAWFKKAYGAQIEQALKGTVFDSDMLVAIACQETGELWSALLRKPGLTPKAIAALCCGDTLDVDKGRKAFPRTREDLLAAPSGERMFEIARAAALAIAEHVPSYAFVKGNPRKFAHGFGVFQCDLQFFRTDPEYFLSGAYRDFGQSLARAVRELKRGESKLKLHDRASLSDDEFCKVAIAYNTGRYDAARGLKQGHCAGRKYYGEFIRDYLALSRKVAGPADARKADGPELVVNTSGADLRMRSAPEVSSPAAGNVIAELANGTRVRLLAGKAVNEFVEVEAEVGGKRLRGFSAARYLAPVALTRAERFPAPQATLP